MGRDRAGRVSRAASAAVLILCAAAVGAPSAAAHPKVMNLTRGLTITKVERIAGLTGGTDGTADFYARLSVGSKRIRTSTKPNANRISPNWRIENTTSNDFDSSANAEISIWDADTGDDDHADVYTGSGRSLRMFFYPTPDWIRDPNAPISLRDRPGDRFYDWLRTWGDEEGRPTIWQTGQLTAYGTASDRARVTFLAFARWEPDFFVSSFGIRENRRLEVRVGNAGNASGFITGYDCTDGVKRVRESDFTRVPAGGTHVEEVELRVSQGTQVTCRVTAKNAVRRPEPHADNNRLTGTPF